MIIQYLKADNTQQFILKGRLDHHTSGKFNEFIQSHYTKAHDVILDAQQLDYISGVGLRSLINLAKLVRTDQMAIRVKAPDGGLMHKLLTLSGFIKILPLLQ